MGNFVELPYERSRSLLISHAQVGLNLVQALHHVVELLPLAVEHFASVGQPALGSGHQADKLLTLAERSLRLGLAGRQQPLPPEVLQDVEDGSPARPQGATTLSLFHTLLGCWHAFPRLTKSWP